MGQQKMLMVNPSQVRAARALLAMTQGQLAERSGVSLSTVVDFERDRRTVAPPSVAAMRAALEGAGVEFIPENGGGVGVRLRSPN